MPTAKEHATDGSSLPTIAVGEPRTAVVSAQEATMLIHCDQPSPSKAETGGTPARGTLPGAPISRRRPVSAGPYPGKSAQLFRALSEHVTGRTTTMPTRRPRHGFFWPGASFILLFNGLLFSWLLVKPGGHDLTVAVDDILQTLGPLLAVPLCLLGGATGRQAWCGQAAGDDEHPGVRPARRRASAPVLLGLGVLSFAVGEGIWTIYELVLHRPPFPSWADAGYLSAYPFLLLGVLLLPARPAPLAARTRVVLDALMTMTAVVTFSWYFILGPTLLQGTESALARILGTAYPIFDLVLVFCLIVLSARSGDRPMRRVVHILSLALGIIVVTDCIFDLQNLQGTYATDGLVDVGWSLGYMLVALAAHGTRLATLERVPVPAAPGAAAGLTVADEAPPLWRLFLPYALVPAVGVLLVVCTWVLHGDFGLRMGVYIGGVLLIVLILLRQILAMQENRALYNRLKASYRLTVASAAQLRQLNEELRATQDELEINNRALADANEQLEAFSYSVAHDLRAPLRGMQGFAAALLEDYADQLDADGQEYARRLDAAAARMDLLIADLLAYSCLSRAAIAVQTVALDAAMASALAQVEQELRQRQAQVHVASELPRVMAHHATLVQVVANLLTNAAKFVAPDTRPKVAVWAEACGPWTRLWVGDNGIGIAPEHHEHIFDVFERLHGIETYPGTGIGLAVVRKGMERLGGRVGLESTVGRGSRFWIELPTAGEGTP
jgi:signal transduction histidine kinase